MMIKDGTGDGGGEASAAAARESGGAGRKAGRRGGAGGGLKKGPWTPAEDAILMEHVRRHGEGNWNAVQRHSGLARCGKSCRLRWANHLRPNLKKGSFSPDEELLILRLHAQLGNKWARMAAQMPGRTDNEIKNYWNTRLKRRQRAGLPIYPPELQEAVRFDRNQQQQHQVQTPPPKQQQQTPAADCRARLTSLRPPPMLDPVGSCPPSGITLPPLPQAPFACQFGFSFPLSPLSPPSNPTSLFQQQLGNYDLNPPPPLSPSFPVKMELPSCQLYPEPTGASGGGDALSHCGLLEALLQDTHVAEEMKIGELLALQAAEEQGAKWAQVFCGGYDGSGNGNCREGIKETSQACLLGSAVKSDCLECNMGTKIKSEPPSNASPVKDDISALLNMPAPTMSIIPDSHDTDREFPNGRSLVMMSDEFGLDVQQLASSLSAASAEQDWNISSWPWNNMPGIC